MWDAFGNPKLSSLAKELIDGKENSTFLALCHPEKLVSKSVQEISSGKLKAAKPIDIFFASQVNLLSLRLLPITLGHIALVLTLLFHHLDPSDRRLFAQSPTEGIPILSAETVFDAYGVERLW